MVACGGRRLGGTVRLALLVAFTASVLLGCAKATPPTTYTDMKTALESYAVELKAGSSDVPEELVSAFNSSPATGASVLLDAHSKGNEDEQLAAVYLVSALDANASVVFVKQCESATVEEMQSVLLSVELLYREANYRRDENRYTTVVDAARSFLVKAVDSGDEWLGKRARYVAERNEILLDGA